MPDALSLDQARRVALAAQGLAAPARAATRRPGHPARHPGAARAPSRSTRSTWSPAATSWSWPPGPAPMTGPPSTGWCTGAGPAWSTGPMPPRSCPWTGSGCACPGCAGWPPPPAAGGSTSARATSTCTARCWTGSGPRGRWPPPPSASPTAPGAAAGGTGRRPSTCSRTCSTRGRCWSTTGSTSSAATTWPSGSCPPGLDTTEPTAAEAALELTLLGARALGVGTAADLADYYRLPARRGPGRPGRGGRRRAAPGGRRGRLGQAGLPAARGPGCRAGWPTRRCCSAPSTR